MGQETRSATLRRLVPPLVRLGLALGLPLLVLVSAYSFFVPSNLANDDVALEMLARGIGLTSHPTPHLIFINIVLGRLLVFLYEYVDVLPWYRVVMIGLHVGSTATLVWLALARRGGPWRVALLLFYLLAYELHFDVRPHFSITASLAALAGLLLWLDVLIHGEPLRWSRLLLMAFFMTASAWVRYESCVMILLAMLPVLLLAGLGYFSANSQQRSHSRLAGLALPLGMIALLVQGSKWYNDAVYAATPGWSDFYEFNRLRAEFTDYHRAPYTAETKPIFDEVGWSAAAYDLLNHWFFEDPRVYNRDTFSRILAHFPPARASAFVEVLGQFVDTAGEDATRRMMLVGLLIPFFFVVRKRSGLLAYGATLLSLLLVSLVIMFFLRRFPPWVYGPLFAVAPASALLLPEAPLAWPWRGHPELPLRVTVIVAASLLIESSLEQLRHASVVTWYQNRALMTAVQKWQPTRDQLYVIAGGVFPYDLLLSANDVGALRKVNLYGPGFLTHSPINQARLAEFGIRDLYAAMSLNPHVFVITEQNFNAAFAQYVKEYYRRQIDDKALTVIPLGESSFYHAPAGKYVSYDRRLIICRFQPVRATRIPPPSPAPSHAPSR